MKDLQIFFLTMYAQVYMVTSAYGGCGDWSFLQLTSNNDYTTTTSVLDTLPVNNPASCVSTCLNHEACASAIFSSDLCYLYSTFLDLNPGGDSSPGALYYQYEGMDECTTGLHDCPTPTHACHDTPRSYTCVCAAGYTGDGDTCTRVIVSLTAISCSGAPDCATPNSRCRSGSCDCQLGYHYNPVDASCLAACSTYGMEFSHQVTGQCYGSGGQIIEEISLSACKDQCINDGTGTCRVVQYDDEDCTIFHTTYLESQTGWGEHGDCSYHQRDCAQ